jgi:hypothetical protein
MSSNGTGGEATHQRVLRRLRLPRSARGVLLLSALLGGLVPIVQIFAPGFGLAVWHGQPWYLHFGFAAVLLLSGASMLRLPRRRVSRLGVATGLAVAVPSAVVVFFTRWLCYGWHVCMGGHAEHPPYDVQDWLLDACWITALLLPAWPLLRARSRLAVPAVMLASWLLSERLIFGSFGGRGFGTLEHPVNATAVWLLEHWPGT